MLVGHAFGLKLTDRAVGDITGWVGLGMQFPCAIFLEIEGLENKNGQELEQWC